MSKLNQLWKRGTDFLGTKYAILGGAMTWVSDRHLVSAISNAGGFGVIACGSMTPDILTEEIRATFKMTDKPFGVNLITMHPQLDELAQVCIDEGVQHVVLAGGLPPKPIIEKLKAADRKVMCFAPALGLAKRLVKQGADAIVLEGMEAGGHIGPVSTSVLVQEIIPNLPSVPIFVAGGIGRGEAIVSYLEMGAAGCQLGTRFVCATEAQVHPDFKKAFIRANARDAVLSPQLDQRFPIIPVRSIRNEAFDNFIKTQREVIQKFDAGELDQTAAQLEIEHFWAGALRRAVKDGDLSGGSIMAGQSVGMVTCEQSTEEIIEELVDQANAALESRGAEDPDIRLVS
ncbi:MAG: NAD(P)H-dependent flavin oxidoreductase [Alphaproteobacteria bacterium]